MGKITNQLDSVEQLAQLSDKNRDLQRRNIALEKRLEECESLLDQKDKAGDDEEKEDANVADADVADVDGAAASCAQDRLVKKTGVDEGFRKVGCKCPSQGLTIMWVPRY